MKVVVIQERLAIPNLNAQEIIDRWAALELLQGVKELVIHHIAHDPSIEELCHMIHQADAVIGLWVSPKVINEGFLNQHSNLKYIATLGHGWESFDHELTRRKGIVITNTIYGANTIAEYTWALLMDICHDVGVHSHYIKTKQWKTTDQFGDFCKVLTPQIELYQKTLGIIGLGSIGFSLAKMAQGFGMKIVSYSKNKKLGKEYDFIEQVTFDEVFRQSDVISLHLPLSPSSTNMINKHTISKMKEGVILLNTARGGLIVEDDLASALQSGKIYAAGLDVLNEEPPAKDCSLLQCDNARITGHIAWLTKEARLRACEVAINNLKAYLDGHPISVIN
jgi:glycerate dehydrogenase